MAVKIQKMRNGWNQWAQKSENHLFAVGRPLNNDELERLIKDITKKLMLTKDHKLLDVGCGSGVFLSRLKNSAKSVYGVDFSEKMIEIAKDIVNDGEFLVSQTKNLPFENNLFDRIICYSVFHYFPDYNYAVKTIEELIRVCKPGGNIFIGDIPSKKHYKNINTPIKKMEGYVKIILKRLVAKIKGKSIKKSLYEYHYIHKSKNWLFYEIDSLCKFVKSRGDPAKVLKQHINRQWNTITYTYRFDILIEKKIRK